jgi:hypothetical protein
MRPLKVYGIKTQFMHAFSFKIITYSYQNISLQMDALAEL